MEETLSKPRSFITTSALLLVLCACPRAREQTPKADTAVSVQTSAPQTQHVVSPVVSADNDTSKEDEAMGCPKLIRDARKGGLDPGRFVQPTPQEQQTVEQAIKQLMTGAAREAVQRSLATVGFRIDTLAEWPGALFVHEETRLRGGGGYVLRPDAKSKSRWAVQAPHTFFDAGTLPLACTMFQKSDARAFFFNTSHRYKSAAKTSEGQNPADVAHSDATLFQAATRGLLASVPGCSIVQLHGFAEREVAFAAVVSAGERRSPVPPHVLSAKSELAKLLGKQVAAYPDDTRELGATTNVQGVLVRRGGGRFLHIEMSAQTRTRLGLEEALAAEVLTALSNVMARP
jgi:hypothetical protein